MGFSIARSIRGGGLDGLVFCLDAANKSSYPGSGTNVSSLIGSMADGTLTNGVGFTSDGGGSFTFDGINDYISIPDDDVFSFGNSSTDSPFSLEVWVNMVTWRPLINKIANNMREWTLVVGSGGNLVFVLYSYQSNFAYQYIDAGDITSYENQWVNIAATYDGRGAPSPYNGMNLYINGSLQSVSKVSNSTYIGMKNGTEPVKIGRQDSLYANGKISVAKIYNKELSASEVLHNYNLLKGRFS